MSLANVKIQTARNFQRIERRFWGQSARPEPGAGAPRVAVAVFDPTANADERTIAAHGLGVTIPADAIITRCMYDVITTFGSAGADAGTIALHAEGAGDLVVAIAISEGTNPWDADADTAHVVVMPAAPHVPKTTESRELTATVAGQALTGGKLYLFVEYILSRAS